MLFRSHGLDKSKFHLFEDGKVQTITSFEEHRPGTETPSVSEPLPPHVYSNKPRYPSTAAVNVLLLDAPSQPVRCRTILNMEKESHLRCSVSVVPGNLRSKA